MDRVEVVAQFLASHTGDSFDFFLEQDPAGCTRFHMLCRHSAQSFDLFWDRIMNADVNRVMEAIKLQGPLGISSLHLSAQHQPHIFRILDGWVFKHAPRSLGDLAASKRRGESLFYITAKHLPSDDFFHIFEHLMASVKPKRLVRLLTENTNGASVASICASRHPEALSKVWTYFHDKPPPNLPDLYRDMMEHKSLLAWIEEYIPEMYDEIAALSNWLK